MKETKFVSERFMVTDAYGVSHHEYSSSGNRRRTVHGHGNGRDFETGDADAASLTASAEIGLRVRQRRPAILGRARESFGGLGPRAALAAFAILVGGALTSPSVAAPSLAEIVAAAPRSEWRDVDPANTLYLDLKAGRVIIELAPRFAPNHVENIRRLAGAKFFDGLSIVRSQDNYVVQWGDADAQRPLGGAKRALKAEFSHHAAHDEPITRLPDPDTYAPVVGFTDGFPAARDSPTGEAWLTHCYGMVGAGRDNDADTGSGAELYAVIGQAPRQLDRNVTLVGRVLRGIELLSVAPRGTEALGFYKTTAEHIPIKRMFIAADLPPAERIPLQALRTDSATFAAVIHSRRFRQDDFYKRPAGAIDVCNVPLPVRDTPRH